MAEKKYYWLKLKKDFFKRHDIRIIEAMPNGKDYILFYLKLLCESVDHNGNLRFSDSIPYNDEMLSTITNTDIDVVRSAINIFTKLNMMDIMDDGTFYMTEVEKMIGSETAWAEKKRLYREQRGHNEDIVLALSDKSKSIEKEIEIDKDNNIFKPPTVEEVRAYCEERNNGIDAEAFVAFYESKGWMVGKNKMKKWKSAVVTWEKSRNDNHGGNKGTNRAKKETGGETGEDDSWFFNH